MVDVSLTTKLVGIKQVETGLGNLDKQIGNLSKSVTNFGKSMTQVGKTLTTRVTLPITAMGAAILKTAGDFEAGLNRVRALTGATADQMEEMEKQARQLGATTQFSAAQAADAMAFMAQAGLDANKILGALPDTLSLAAAAQIDMGRAADIVTNIMAGFRLETSDLGRAVDVLTATFTNSNTDINQMAEAMKFVGPIASGFKVSMEETAAAVGLLGNAGIQGSLAGTTLRNVLIRLADPADEAAQLLSQLGINAFDAAGKFVGFIGIIEQMEVAGANTAQILKIFAARAGPGMEVLLSQGSVALRAFTTDLENAGGTAERIAKIQMEGFNGAMRELVSAAQELTIAIGASGFLKAATDFARNIADMVRALAAVNPEFLKWGTIIAGVAAIIGPLVATFGIFVILLGKGLRPIQLIAVALLNFRKATLPILAVVAAVAALIAVGIAVQRQWEQVGDTWESITIKMDVAWQAFLVKATSGLGKLVSAMGEFLEVDKFIEFGKTLDETSKKFEVDLVEALEKSADRGNDVGESLKATFAAVSQEIGDLVLETAKTIKGFQGLRIEINELDKGKETIKDMSEAMRKFQEASRASLEPVKEIAKTVETDFDKAVTGMRVATENYFKSIRDVAANTEAALTNVFKGLEDALTQFFLTGKFEFSDFVDIIKQELARLAARDVLSNLGGLVTDLLGGATGGGQSGGGSTGLIGGIIRTVGGFFGNFLAAGGPVMGPGGPTDDSILARLSNGEFVIQASAAKKLGADRLNILNEGQLPAFGFGGGVGEVGSSPGVDSSGSSGVDGIGGTNATFGIGQGSPTGIGFTTVAQLIQPQTTGSFLEQGGRTLLTEISDFLTGNTTAPPSGGSGLSAAQINAIATESGIASVVNLNAQQQAEFIAPLIGLGPIGIAMQIGLALAEMFGNHGPGTLMDESDIAGHGGEQILDSILTGGPGFTSPAGGDNLGLFGDTGGKIMGDALRTLLASGEIALASMATGGDRVFTRPTLLSVAENGPEQIIGRPMGSGGMRGGGISIFIEGDAVFDDITADDLARKVAERVENQSARGLI